MRGEPIHAEQGGGESEASAGEARRRRARGRGDARWVGRSGSGLGAGGQPFGQFLVRLRVRMLPRRISPTGFRC